VGLHAEWLAAVREAASADGYPLVINARVDVFLRPFLAGARAQEEFVPDAVRRAHAYREAGVDCVFPITLCEAGALRRFMAEVDAPVNVVRLPQAPSIGELAALGVARVSWGASLHRAAMAGFASRLATLQG
jgi:2-methylisocitrate lyase-like PEP mutase family enzyme